MEEINKKARELFARANLLYRSGKQEESLPLYRQAAELGHPQAMSTLGGFYMNGHLVGKDTSEGFRLLEDAATLDDQIGMTWLARLLLEGDDTMLPDPQKAAYWTGRYLMLSGDLITAKELLDDIVKADSAANDYFERIQNREEEDRRFSES